MALPFLPVDAVVKKVERPLRRSIIRTAFRRALSAEPMVAVGPDDVAFIGIRSTPPSSSAGGGSSSILERAVLRRLL